MGFFSNTGMSVRVLCSFVALQTWLASSVGVRLYPCGDAGYQDVVENTAITFYCDQYNTSVDWKYKSPISDTPSTLSTCPAPGSTTSCSEPPSEWRMTFISVDNSSLTSLHTDRSRYQSGGEYHCVSEGNTDKCGLHVIVPAVVSETTTPVITRQDRGYIVSLSADITRVYSSRGLYSCLWQFGQNWITGTPDLNYPASDADNTIDRSGSCGLTFYLPSYTGDLSCSVTVNPGDTRKPFDTITITRPSPPTISCPTDVITENTSLTCTCNTNNIGQPGGRLMWYTGTGTDVSTEVISGNYDVSSLSMKWRVSLDDHNVRKFRCVNIWTVVIQAQNDYTAQVASAGTTVPLDESDKTSVLRNMTKSGVTAETVSGTREVLEQPGETAAADVVLVAEILHQASQLQNISVQMATDLLMVVDSVSELNQSVLQQSNTMDNTTNRLIMAVEGVADRVILEGAYVRLQTNSTVLQVWNLTAASQSVVLGLRVTTGGEVQDITAAPLTHDDTDTAVWIPAEIGRQIVKENPGRDVRLSVVVIQQTGLFQARWATDRADTAVPDKPSTEQGAEYSGPSTRFRLNSKVISVRITVDGQPITDLSPYGQGNVTSVFALLKPASPELLAEEARPRKRVQCVFWDFALRQGRGGWSNEGCHLGHLLSNTTTCLCDHLTNFAVLMDLYGQEVKEDRLDEEILSVISTVGLAVSICGLTLTLLAFLLVKKLRKSLPQQALFNMALAMLLSWVTFLAGIQRVESHVACVAVAMLLHYFILVSFLWTLAQGALLYAMLVKVMRRPFTHFLLKAGLPAWGLPLLVVIIMSAVDVDLYHGGDRYCWMSLTAFYYAFLTPIAVIIVINIVIYVMVVVSICRRPKTSSSGTTSYITIGVRASLSCFVILGLSWVFAFFALKDARLVFQYLFTCTTALQGFLIFALYTARDPDVRDFCLNKLGKGEGRTAGKSASAERVVKSSSEETSFD